MYGAFGEWARLQRRLVLSGNYMPTEDERWRLHRLQDIFDEVTLDAALRLILRMSAGRRLRP